MEWTLACLFGISALLLIVSIKKNRNASKEEQKGIDLVHVSLMKEINDIQETIRNIELDIEVVMKEAGSQLSPQEKLFMREVLDLYKRDYSMASIAEKKQVPVSEIEELLAPFQALKNERRKVANEN
ncbi:hypothetical protein [Neobacillus massiliamazoniensis]|uniref:DUF2802 domain-containing protein n=1 Tax=Neobacillus massiliamazoniensis TaxID=1499688 RepID=A0A0U1NZ03_9BACI|nr:hypothetical protein [Neobacillus massiliamazoniensis]CRK83203.1 hypothetical protein BN000_03163 [Neobacillus massiliamazoniensis]